MKRITPILILALVLLLGMPSVDYIDNLAYAANIMSAESFQAMTPYGVPEAADTSTSMRKKPAIFWGSDMDGTITFATGTYQNSFNTSCLPVVIITPCETADVSNVGLEVHIKTIAYNQCTYEVRRNTNGTVTDVTSTVSVKWVAFGWR